MFLLAGAGAGAIALNNAALAKDHLEQVALHAAAQQTAMVSWDQVAQASLSEAVVAAQ
jgi:hypothetical protein